MKIFSRQAPWYVAGLAFECTGCGNCCAGPEEGYVWVKDADIAAIARVLGISNQEMRDQYVRKVGRRYSLVEKPNRDCIFLQADPDTGTRGCKVYGARPTQCRTWPFWPSNLASADDWCEAAMRCPGINRGERFEFDHIEQQRMKTLE
ncbi:MAG: YkgJ family cysteine cluster protein [Phycisphaerae bacterium]